jgi:hypothetical protein
VGPPLRVGMRPHVARYIGSACIRREEATWGLPYAGAGWGVPYAGDEGLTERRDVATVVVMMALGVRRLGTDG